ncbi:MAG: hypothetical protein NTZ23_09380 [Cyanobium sp. LacPavin_0920_WC12_MAG_63_22]|nr:hypothetical protein [Cyanobium sp. LacPavin_0920_WC12_MAG_63_22]
MTPTSNPDQASQELSQKVNQEVILAASSPWVAVVLNLVPGLGTGYIYQRRWRAYWISSGLATAWFVAGGVLSQNVDEVLMPDLVQQNQLIGLGGLLLLAVVTATEAGLAARRAQPSSRQANP